MDQACCKVVLLTRMRIHPDIGTISSHPQALIEAESRLKKKKKKKNAGRQISQRRDSKGLKTP